MTTVSPMPSPHGQILKVPPKASFERKRLGEIKKLARISLSFITLCPSTQVAADLVATIGGNEMDRRV